MKNYYTAIVFFQKEKNKSPYKYRNIDNFANFENFLKKTYQDLHYVNYYNKQNKLYYGRKYFVSSP
jgi:hypothetical protein